MLAMDSRSAGRYAASADPGRSPNEMIENMMIKKTTILWAIILSLTAFRCWTMADEYQPAVLAKEDEQGKWWKFSKSQLEHMHKVPLDTARFLKYLQQKWTLDRIRRYCIPQNRFPEAWQNLVGNEVFRSSLYTNAPNEFAEILVYVCDDYESCLYSDGAKREWNRWTYSLNISSSNAVWVIIETLPNNFMDALPKPGEPTAAAAANLGQ